MQLRGLKYSGPFMCTTEKYLTLITTTLYNSEIIHWGTTRWNPRQMLDAAGQQKAWGQQDQSNVSSKYQTKSSASSTQMPYVMSKYEPKKGVRITYSQLPVSCHDCSRKERGQRWGHMPAEQMLPSPTQTTHGPATLKNLPLFFHKQKSPSNLTAQFVQLCKLQCLWLCRAFEQQTGSMFGSLLLGVIMSTINFDCSRWTFILNISSIILKASKIASRVTTFSAQDLSWRGPQLGAATMLHTSKILQRHTEGIVGDT